MDEMVVFKILSENFNLFFEIVYFLLNLFILCVLKIKKVKIWVKFLFIYLLKLNFVLSIIFGMFVINFVYFN